MCNTVTLSLTPANIALLLLFSSACCHYLSQYFYFYYRLAFGTLYPSYSSYKAIKNKDVREYSRWMMYWVCYGIFSAAEVFTDIFIGFWLPFYYEIKILFILWLTSSYGNGARIMYKNIIHPELNRREELIDTYILTAKEIGVTSLVHFCRKCSDLFNNAFSRVLHATQLAIVNQLHNHTLQLGAASLVPALLSPNVGEANPCRNEEISLFDDTTDRNLNRVNEATQQCDMNTNPTLSSAHRSFSIESLEHNFAAFNEDDNFRAPKSEPSTAVESEVGDDTKRRRRVRKTSSNDETSVASRRSKRQAAMKARVKTEMDIEEID